MSGAPHDAINVRDAEIGDDQYPSQSAPNQESQGMSNFVDSSGPIFSMYLQMAEEEDKKMAEGWKADADGILIFTGLFSASVASLISVSIQDLRQNPQDTSNFYLANIYQTVADPNRSNTSSSLPSPPPFSPPNYAVWVNALWFLSLVISITCALLATLLQQWARRYLKVTQPRYSLHKRAQIRAFFFEGVEKFLLPLMVEVLPALLHVSLFLFFDGLVVFLWNVDLTIFKLVLSWVGLCAALYGCITFMPIFRHNSPCHTPLSSWVWLLGSWIRYVFNSFRLSALWVCIRDLSGLWVRIRRLPVVWARNRRLSGLWARTRDLSGLSVPIRGLSVRIRTLLYMGMQKAVEKTALHSPSEIVTRAFLWTFDSLDEDHELERFFSGLPGFRSSKVVEDPLLSLPSEQKEKLSTTLMGLFDRTFSSDLLPEPAKNRRAVICAKALDPAEFPYAYWQIINKISFDDQCRGLQTAEFGRVMRSWGGGGDRRLVVEVIFASIVARAQRYGDPWLLFASNELGIPESDLRDYAAQGDNWSLAALIHITRQQFDHLGESSWPRHGLSKVLGAASEFNVQNTSPQLQHEFCALWHQVVRKAWVNGWWITWDTTLRPIRNVYIALHQDTPTQFSASTRDEANEDFDGDRVSFHSISYPLCNIPGHHPEPTPHTHNVSASTTPARTALYDNAALSPAPLAGPDVPSSSVPAPRRVDESLTDVPPLDNNIYVPGSFHAAYQTVIEHLRIPATSQDPVTARVIQGGIGISTTMIPLSAPEPLASTHPTSMASTSPPGAVAVQHIADRRTSSDVLDVPSLPSPTPVLDNMLPTESHSSPLAPAVPSLPHPRLTSAPDLGAAAEGDGSTKAAFRKRKEEDTLYSSSEIRNNIITTSDPRPQSPSPPSVTDIAIAGPSQRTLDAEHTKDNPPHPSHGQFDIV